MFSSPTGIIHTLAAFAALATGTLVLFNTKGNARHRRVGYGYVLSMLVVLSTSFMLYNVHGTFGVLHWFAVISSVSLLGGMVPMLLRRPANYVGYHFSFMYWSVIGLYCALFAEILTRIPLLLEVEDNVIAVFYAMVAVATAVVGGIGSRYFKIYKERWSAFVDPA